MCDWGFEPKMWQCEGCIKEGKILVATNLAWEIGTFRLYRWVSIQNTSLTRYYAKKIV